MRASRSGNAQFSPWTASIAACVLSATLTSCGASHVDDLPALQALGLDKPVTVAVPLNTIADAQGNLQENFNTHVVALLVKGGFLDAVAAPESEPYWRLGVKSGTAKSEGVLDAQDRTYVIRIARREIVERSNERNWYEGSIQFFAETVSYKFVFDEAIAALVSRKEIGPAALRLVMENDPARGAWQISIDRGTTSNDSELVTALNGVLDVAGQAAEQELLAKITAIRQQRYAAIEAENAKIANNLATEGVIEHGTDPNVLVGRRSGLAFYIGTSGKAPSSIMDARSYCSKIQTSGYRGWRIPTRKELGTAVRDGKLADAPDGRLWGNIAKIPDNVSEINFITDVVVVQPPRNSTASPRMSIYNAEFPQSVFGDWVNASVESWTLSRDRSMVPSTVGAGSSMTGLIAREEVLNRDLVGGAVRLVCVAPMSRR